tara:strand:+ start:589 stop:1521 length:933 start_codon:yes stop_codon:yes gene_type:complete
MTTKTDTDSAFDDIPLVKIHQWGEEHEKILVDWADKAMCYKWLHSQANSSYSIKAKWFTIPVIIISTLTGTANFAQERVPSSALSLYVMIVGGLNITAGIISTIAQFLKINELVESHRVSSIGWDKFYRNIKVEIAKKPNERINIQQMLKMCKEEYDRLIETSPKIEQPIIDKFKKTFKKTPYYDKIRKPEICDDLISTELFRFIPDKTVKNTKSMIFDAKKTKILIEKQNEINRVIISFEENQSRYPLLDELIDQVNFSSEEMITLELEDDKDISEFILQILTQYETNKKDLNIDIEMGTKILSETKID